MKFTIPCETFYRLSQILSYFQDDIDEEIKSKINCIRLENYKGQLFAIATNVKVAAVELIGATTEPDGVAHVIANENLVNICQKEKAFNSFLEINLMPELAIASAKTMFGYQYAGNPCVFFDNTPLDGWRGWASDEHVKDKGGAMYWDLNHMSLLNASSPSGKISFPEIINIDIPVVLRDIENPNWVGLCMPKNISITPATLPEWWTK